MLAVIMPGCGGAHLVLCPLLQLKMTSDRMQTHSDKTMLRGSAEIVTCVQRPVNSKLN